MPSPPDFQSGGGQARCRLMAGDGRGLVVVRARERRVHGEGGQQVMQERMLECREALVNTDELEQAVIWAPGTGDPGQTAPLGR